MGFRKIDSWAKANGLLLDEMRRREQELAATHRPTGRDEAVVAQASQRDRLKFIPRRLN